MSSQAAADPDQIDDSSVLLAQHQWDKRQCRVPKIKGLERRSYVFVA